MLRLHILAHTNGTRRCWVSCVGTGQCLGSGRVSSSYVIPGEASHPHRERNPVKRPTYPTTELGKMSLYRSNFSAVRFFAGLLESLLYSNSTRNRTNGDLWAWNDSQQSLKNSARG